MKDEHRKYYNCIFCGQKMSNSNSDPHKRTAEHILGKCVARNLPKTTNWNGSVDVLASQNPLKGSSPPQYMTSHTVCSKCNGQLGPDVEQAKDLVIELCMTSKKRILDEKDQNTLTTYFQRIAIIRDVESSNLDLDKTEGDLFAYARKFGSSHLYPPIIDCRQRRDFLSGKFAPNVSISIGQTPWWGGRNRLFMCEDIPHPFSLEHLGARRMQFFIEKLAVRLHVGAINGDEIGSFVPLGVNSEIAWPPKSLVGAEQIYSSVGPNEEYEAIRRQFKNRRNRCRMIKEFRKTGYWVFDARLETNKPSV